VSCGALFLTTFKFIYPYHYSSSSEWILEMTFISVAGNAGSIVPYSHYVCIKTYANVEIVIFGGMRQKPKQ
jgi:hypothetical protein